LNFLKEDKIRRTLIAAATAGDPPVAAISRSLVERVGSKDVKSAQVKQFTGLSVRAVLEEEGFEVARTGVWLGDDPVFSTGAVYRKVTPQKTTAGGSDFMDRLARTLNDDEAHRLFDILRKRLKR
jgi:hypothetical protein